MITILGPIFNIINDHLISIRIYILITNRIFILNTILSVLMLSG